MKKKLFFGIGITFIVLLIFALIHLFLVPDGKTLESREQLLQQSNVKNQVWQIDKEIKVQDYIISSVYGNKEGLAVFQPTSNGRYKLQSVTMSEKGRVIRTSIIYNTEVYYIATCNQSDLLYAEVIYTIDNEELEPRRYDVSENSLIYFKSPSDDFSMRIVYYDKNGNHYDY